MPNRAVSTVVHQLIQRIYESAVAPERWRHFLELFAEHLGSKLAFLTYVDRKNPHTTVQAVVGWDAPVLQLYYQRWAHRDPFVQRGQQLGLFRPGFIGLGRDILPDEELRTTAFYQEFGRHHHYYGGITGIVEADHRIVAALSANRPENGEFGEAELNLFRDLMPHLRTSFRLYRHIHDSTQLGRAALGTLNGLLAAVFICDPDARVVHMNASAAELSARGPLHVTAGRLSTTEGADSVRLQRLILTASEADGPEGDTTTPAVVQIESDDTATLACVVSPLADDHATPGMPMLVSVMVHDPRVVTPSVQRRVQAIYGLTTAELRIAVKLLEGRTLDDTASLCRISRETARTHLRHLFEKTGTHRQADLVRVLLTSLPV